LIFKLFHVDWMIIDMVCCMVTWLWFHTLEIPLLIYLFGSNFEKRSNHLVAFYNRCRIQSMCHVVAKVIDNDYSWATKLVKLSTELETWTDLLWDGYICLIYIDSNYKNTWWVMHPKEKGTIRTYEAWIQTRTSDTTRTPTQIII